MINEIKIRQATIEDLPKIQKLSLELFKEEQSKYESAYNNDWSFSEEGESFFKKELTESNRIVFLAEDGKMPIGYLAASSYTDNVFQGPLIFAELVNIFIKDEYRNRKIGTELTNKFIEWAKQKNAKRIIVTAHAENINGIKFYEKNGFTDWHTKLKIDLE